MMKQVIRQAFFHSHTYLEPDEEVNGTDELDRVGG